MPTQFSAADTAVMRALLAAAREAAVAGETPVAAAIVARGQVIATAANRTRAAAFAAEHAELAAMRAACAALRLPRLDDCELFVTLEPCTMCLGAAVLLRVRRVVFGAASPKAGACGGALDLLPRLNHQPIVEGGLLADECGRLLSEFFEQRRE